MKTKIVVAIVSATLCSVGNIVAAQAQSVKPTGAANLKKQIAAARGKVTIVNFWATWCPPCVAEMPHLSKLRRNYASRGLNLVLVNANEIGDAQKIVKPFLKKNALPMSWIVGGSTDAFIKGFDPKLKTQFELPRTYVYNRQGKLVRVFAGEKNYAQWEALLKPLL